MALRKEELEPYTPGTYDLANFVSDKQTQKSSNSEPYINGLYRTVKFSNGKTRKFRYDNLLKLKWISDSDGGYFRPDVNGQWCRKSMFERVLITNLKVDKEGIVSYERIMDKKPVSSFEKLDGSRISKDESGRIVCIEYPNGTIRSFEYNHFGQLCRYLDADGSIWIAEDEVLWRKWPATSTEMQAVMEIEDDGTCNYLFLGKPGNEHPCFNQRRTNGSTQTDLPLDTALQSMIERNISKLPLSKDGSITADSLYETLQDKSITGPLRLSVVILSDYAKRKTLKSVTREEIQSATTGFDYAASCTSLLVQSLRLIKVSTPSPIKENSRASKLAGLRQGLKGKAQ